MGIERTTVREELAWHYANLAMADAALQENATAYSVKYFMIRSKLYKGIVTETMRIKSFFDDEKFKIGNCSCCYCGDEDNLSLDHLMPRKKLGSDLSENLIYACRSCNSSKRERDMVTWLRSQGRFPGIYLLRRYLKLAYFYCQKETLLDCSIAQAYIMDWPFEFNRLGENLAPLQNLCVLNLYHTTSL